jgi:hypothetical protein
MSVPISCQKWRCAKCRDRKCKQLMARALSGELVREYDGYTARYTHKLLTLTCPGEEYRSSRTPAQVLEEMTHAWHKLVTALRKTWGHFHFMRVCEAQRDGYPHFHCILSGSNISPKSVYDDISKLWREHYGMGFMRLNAIKKHSAVNAVKYVMKYLFKEPMELPKGKRLYTASRGALDPKHTVDREWYIHRIGDHPNPEFLHLKEFDHEQFSDLPSHMKQLLWEYMAGKELPRIREQSF